MELTNEDTLRLNVLLANKPQAIRIDESSMTVLGLTPQGEVRVQLNPSGRSEPYLRKVRELLSGHVLGSPGGYPVYLKRWTRMGQMRDESLEQLLLLGEPEAVVAAVCAPGISDELARRAWWAMEDAENGRRLLSSPAVAQGSMGPVLAAYLVDYLPFETEPESMIESVRLVLQPGLLDAAGRADLWKKARRKLAYYVGFLAAIPDELPAEARPMALPESQREALEGMVADSNPCARQLLRVCGAPGQAYLDTVQRVLDKPPTQDVVTITLDLVADYFSALRPEGRQDQVIEALLDDAEGCRAGEAAAETGIGECLARCPDLAPQVRAMRLLSGLGYGVVRPVLRDSTAIGTLMRRKLEPVLAPVRAQIAVLRAE